MKMVLRTRYFAISAALLLFALLPRYAAAVNVFVDNGDGTVTDSNTGLMWQRCSVGQTWSGTACTGDAGSYPLETALTTVFEFAGYSDWRVPTAEEIITIRDPSKGNPTIDTVVFPNMPADSPYYWTASPYIDDQHGGHHWWLINFTDFGNVWGDVDWVTPYRLRLVRTLVAAGFYALNVAKGGSGLGTVSSTPAGITNCASSCSASFAAATNVTLTATPGAASTFAGWSGACTGTGSCTVAMDSTKSVVATFAQDGNITLSMGQGWNLLGNSQTQTLSVASVFGDPNVVITVWKWDSTLAGWQFYSPLMTPAELQTYAASKGYAVLSQLQPGDGFWVNSKSQTTLPTLQGSLFTLLASHLKSGWNLVATGHDAATPPLLAMSIPMTTLWAWNNQFSLWYFYAPSLDADRTLATYIGNKGYMDFATSSKTLGNGTGFWVNRP